jgi:hypothetical protein
MIIIEGVAERKNQKGETFVSLLLTGNVEMVKNKKGGFYATVRKASVPSTISLVAAKSLIGTKMPGTIKKVPCEAYMFKTQSGEEVEIDFTYEYSEEAENVAETIFS